jgi:hypothetical protein
VHCGAGEPLGSGEVRLRASSSPRATTAPRRFSITSRTSNTTRSYRGFSQAVDEVIDARVYSGIHFRKADDDGAAIGEDVARYGLKRYFERD